MSGARATVEALEREKVEYIFGMPGGANLPFYDALWDSKIKHVLVRHEQLAAHMADAYGRVSRKAGVCSATSGPGGNGTGPAGTTWSRHLTRASRRPPSQAPPPDCTCYSA